MAYLTQQSTYNAVLSETSQYKSIPTITIRASTYKAVFEKLSQFDNAKEVQPQNDLLITTALISLKSAIEDWMVKPAHQQAFANSNSEESGIKKTFSPLLAEVDQALHNSWQAKDVKAVIGKETSEKLAAQLIQNAGYSASSNPLLVLLMNNLVNTYKLNAITNENFCRELLNFVVASNDLRGASSFLIQALGDKGAFSFSIDFGKLILPFLQLSLDLGVAKTTNSNTIIYFDCLATDFNENGEDLRYGFYTLHGWSREYQGEIGVTAGVEISTSSGSPLIELEVAGINALPSIDSPSASAGVKAGVKVKTNWTILNTTDLTPAFFTSIESKDIAQRVLSAITSPLPKSIVFNNERGVVLNIYSNAYGGDAFASAEASGDVPVVGVSVSASGNVKADIRKSTIVLQAPSSSRPNMKKTQMTQIWLKQLGANASLVASGKLLGTSKDLATKEVEYSFVNSYSYSSTCIYWNNQSGAKSFSALPRTGYTRGQSVNAKSLISRMTSFNSNINYFLAIAKQLKVRVELIKSFLENNASLITDIIDTATYYVDKGELSDSVLSAFVIESSFALKKSANLKFALDESTAFPEDEVQDQLAKEENLYLESLRLRVPRLSRSYKEKPGFKLGVNLGIVKFGIDLGMIEEASTIAMDDLVVEWFETGGKGIGDRPADYVPSTAIIL